MTGDEELLQVERVITRMITRFPNVSPAAVENSVRTIHGRFIGCRIRDFVPLLVEKAAKADITALVSANPHDLHGDSTFRISSSLPREERSSSALAGAVSEGAY